VAKSHIIKATIKAKMYADKNTNILDHLKNIRDFFKLKLYLRINGVTKSSVRSIVSFVQLPSENYLR